MEDTLPNARSVLIVDDEEMVLTLGRVILERHGYQVRVARSGDQAIAMCREAQSPPDCVIIDYTMPVMNGRETLLEIRKVLPTVPAIISSGYSDDEVNQKMADIAVNGLIHKPYRRESLLATLDAVFSPPQ